MTDVSLASRVLTLVFTDLADSTALKTEHGDVAVGELIARHRKEVVRLEQHCGGRIIDWAGDGCFLTFETPSAAVQFSLRNEAKFTSPKSMGSQSARIECPTRRKRFITSRPALESLRPRPSCCSSSRVSYPSTTSYQSICRTGHAARKSLFIIC